MNVTNTPLPVGGQLRALSLSLIWRGTEPLAPLHDISLSFCHLPPPGPGRGCETAPEPGGDTGGEGPGLARAGVRAPGKWRKGERGSGGERESFVVLSSFVPELT